MVSPAEAVLEFRALSKIYGTGSAAVAALNEVDLSIAPGEDAGHSLHGVLFHPLFIKFSLNFWGDYLSS